jgi:hypothetical protein
MQRPIAHPLSWKSPHIKHGFGDLKDHWFRFKTVVYNLPTGQVKLENWLDPLNNNNWTKIGEYLDQVAGEKMELNVAENLIK